MAVGRSARAGVVWSGGNRAGRNGVGMVGACGAKRPQLHRIWAVVGRVGGDGGRSGHAESGLKSNAALAPGVRREWGESAGSGWGRCETGRVRVPKDIGEGGVR